MKWLLFISVIFSISALTPKAVADESIPLEKLKNLANTEGPGLGDKVFVYFWASWCPECREKLTGQLQKLQTAFPRYKFITINADRDPAKGLQFAESEKLKFPIYRDDDKLLTKSLKLFAVPAWAVLEKSSTGGWQTRVASTGADIQTIEEELRK